MNKTNKKTSGFDTKLIQLLENRHGVTKDYIRKSIKGERNGVIPLRIAEEYKILKKHNLISEKKALEQIDSQK